MKVLTIVSIRTAALGLVLLGSPAHAIPRTFVSAAGSGTACTRTAPCATFQAAHDATDAGGEINCIDDGNFGGPTPGTALTITKSITIDCTGVVASLSGFANDGIRINTAGAVVRLRHVIIDTTNSDFGFAIRVDNAAALFVESCAIAGRDPTGAQTSAGILFEPASPLAKLFISDTTIENVVDSGVVIDTRNTGPGGSARAVLDRVRLEKNAVSVFLAGPKDPTQANIAHIRDSVVANGNGGVVAVGPDTGGVASLTIGRSSIVFSRLQGIDADGPRAFVLLGRSTVISNGTGLSAREGGSIFSYQNNHATGNVSDGAPSGTLTLK